MSSATRNDKLDRAGLGQYWSRLSERHLAAGDADLGAIIYAGMPAWFNKLVDVFQHKALDRLLEGTDVSNKRVLDVGTGIGRWARWYSRYAGNQVVGVDAEPNRLASALSADRRITYLQMPVDNLAFPDETFDIVHCVAVLQHVHDEVKQRAIAEFCRVLKPGGSMILCELTDMGDDAAHTFPWPSRKWSSEFAKHGLAARRTIGVDYLPLLRLLKAVFKALQRDRAAQGIAEMKSESRPGLSGMIMGPLRIATYLSYPIEEVVRFLPPQYARMTCYLFERPSASG